MRVRNKFSWFDPSSSVKNTLSHGHHSVSFKEALVRVGAGRLDTPAQYAKKNIIALNEFTVPMRHDSFNHVGIYDYLTAGIPYLLESFLRGNWLQSEKNRFIMKVCTGLFWIPLAFARAVVGGLLGLLAAPVIVMLSDSLVTQQQTVDLQSLIHSTDPRYNNTDTPPARTSPTATASFMQTGAGLPSRQQPDLPPSVTHKMQ